jgi:hypothetical protein
MRDCIACSGADTPADCDTCQGPDVSTWVAIKDSSLGLPAFESEDRARQWVGGDNGLLVGLDCAGEPIIHVEIHAGGGSRSPWERVVTV